MTIRREKASHEQEHQQWREKEILEKSGAKTGYSRNAPRLSLNQRQLLAKTVAVVDFYLADSHWPNTLAHSTYAPISDCAEREDGP